MASRTGWVEDGVGYIPLTQGRIAIVDPDWVDELSRLTWHAQWFPVFRGYYAATTKVDSGKHERIYMHRYILGLSRGERVVSDHVNHDTLDNRTANLRIATYSQNQKNRKKAPLGIRLKGGRWEASIKVQSVTQYLGRFDTPEEAGAAYRAAAEIHFGEYAYA